MKGNFTEGGWDPSIEDSYHKEVEIDGEKCVIEINDTGGRSEYSLITNYYAKKAHGMLLIYDVTNRASFEYLDNWMSKIQQNREDMCPCVLVGNKTDLENGREVTSLEGEELGKSLNMPFFETSAKDNSDIINAFTAAAKLAAKYKEANPVKEPAVAKKKTIFTKIKSAFNGVLVKA